MIPMFCVYSENYKPLYDRFVASVPSGFELKPKLIQLEPPFHFQSDSWYNAIHQKLTYVLDSLKSEVPEDSLVCISDTDILFLKDTNELHTYVKRSFQLDRYLQIMFMEENQLKKPNGGFIVLRNTKKVRSFLEQALEAVLQKLPFADQTFYEQNIHKIRHHYILRDYVIWGTKIHCPQKALFHHAVCCSTVEQKLQQQDSILQSLAKLKK